MSKRFLVIVFIISATFGLKYDCSLNDTIHLNLNQIVFFETLNYPLFHYPYCRLNFSMIKPTQNQALIIAFVAGFPKENNYAVSDRDFSLSTFHFNDDRSSAIQGFVTHEDIEAGCPMEALSTPLFLHDETEIIYIRSTYYKNLKRIRPCKWEFKTSHKYGFKIVIEKLNITSSTELTVRNSTEAFLNDRLVMLYHPYYNRDNNLQITLSYDISSTFIPEMEFQAYVTVVKNQNHKIDANCDVDNRTYDLTLWHSNLDNGYPNNAHCSTSFVIFPKHFVLISIEEYDVERGVDFVQYSINGGNMTKIEDEQKFIIEVKKDEPRKFVWFEFVSDGSVEAYGFEIYFFSYICECAMNVVPCNIFEWTFVNAPELDTYCSNLKCHFTFEPCPGNVNQIYVDSDDEDVFIFKSNNETVLEINKYNHKNGEFIVHFNENNVNTLEVFTSSSTKYRHFRIQNRKDYNNMVESQISISTDQPFDIVDNSQFNVIEVSQHEADTNFGFVLYSNHEPSDIFLYNNKSFTTIYSDKECSRNLENIANFGLIDLIYKKSKFENIGLAKYTLFYSFGYLDPYKCILPYQSFVVSFDTSPYSFYTFLAVRLSKPSLGCVLEENIFVARKTDETRSLVGISNSEGACVLKLLIAKNIHFYISNIWTNSYRENVKIYVGMDTSHLLFEFNAKTMKKLDEIILFSSFYYIHIPSNTTMWMTLKRQPSTPIMNGYELPKLTIVHPFRSIIATPHFNTFNNVNCTYEFQGNFLSIVVGNISVKFSVIHYKISDLNNFFLLINGEELNINITNGYSMTFKNQVIDLIYYGPFGFNFDNSQGVIIFLETETK